MLITGLILFNGLFGIFSDPTISRRKLAAVFFLKALAIPTFYYVYEHHYEGLANFDSGKFYNDARVLNACAKRHPATFLALFSGVQNEGKVTGDHVECLSSTQNWVKGNADRFFYHDNRLLIRVHTLLHFIAFDSWFVHALFSCLLSFIGLFFLYKTLSVYLAGKELVTLIVLCFFPALWFYTGGLLKEGLLLFVLGMALWLIRKAIAGELRARGIFVLVIIVALSCLLKPYLLLTCEALFTLCFFFSHKQMRWSGLLLVLITVGIAAMANTVVMAVREKSIFDNLASQQRVFKGMAAGGIFLSGDTTYVRLPYDTTLVKAADASGKYFTISRGVSYMYFNDSRNQDTLYEDFNTDTITQWKLEFATPASRSNIQMPDPSEAPVAAVGTGLYYALLYPLFFNAASAMDVLASCENLLLIIALIVTLGGIIVSRKPRLFPLTCLLLVLIIFVIVSLSSPNAGAIVRYRAPAAVFLLLSALYYRERFLRRLGWLSPW